MPQRPKTFRLSPSPKDIELRSGDLLWDLHNFAKFDGLELFPADNAVVMKWSARKSPNPWGCKENRFLGMQLYFTGLLYLTVTPRDPEMPSKEDLCVSEILQVDPTIHGGLYMRTRKRWVAGDEYRLAFRFQSERIIEIESKSVKLIPIE
jgi:hypothetical protein